MSKIDTTITHITPVGGNVFADLGFDLQESATLKIKMDLMIQISEWVKDKHLKQKEAAEVLQIHRPRVSDIIQGKTSKFTIDTLIKILGRIGKQVTVQVN